MPLRLLLTTTALFIFITSYCQQPSISGTVNDSVTNKPLAGAKVSLVIINSSKYAPVAVAVTDTAGNYYLNNITPGQYNLLCFYKMKHPYFDSLSDIAQYSGRYGVDSNIVISPAQAYTYNFQLMVTCPYNKTKDQAFCPVCKKTDMVQPILWGLPLFDLNGKFILNDKEEDLNKFYLGGCSPDAFCNPSKHCNRCNVGF